MVDMLNFETLLSLVGSNPRRQIYQGRGTTSNNIRRFVVPWYSQWISSNEQLLQHFQPWCSFALLYVFGCSQSFQLTFYDLCTENSEVWECFFKVLCLQVWYLGKTPINYMLSKFWTSGFRVGICDRGFSNWV